MKKTYLESNLHIAINHFRFYRKRKRVSVGFKVVNNYPKCKSSDRSPPSYSKTLPSYRTF